MKIIKQVTMAMTTTFAALAILSQPAFAADEPVIVNVDNFVRAETAAQFDRFLLAAGDINKFHHNRVPTPLDEQSVIRMNRDTLYSFAVVDISKGATLTLPDVGDRYMSAMIVNEDQYINEVFHNGGTYELTMEKHGTPYVLEVNTVPGLTDHSLVPIAAKQAGINFGFGCEGIC